MSKLSRIAPRSPRGIIIAVVAALLLLIGAWQGLRAWWLHGFSRGTRTGYVRKISFKGSPLCKYWSVELDMSNTAVRQDKDLVDMTIDGPRSNNPLIGQIQAAEASGNKTTLEYRQDKGRWWSCSPSEYYVTGVYHQAH